MSNPYEPPRFSPSDRAPEPVAPDDDTNVVRAVFAFGLMVLVLAALALASTAIGAYVNSLAAAASR